MKHRRMGAILGSLLLLLSLLTACHTPDTPAETTANATGDTTAAEPTDTDDMETVTGNPAASDESDTATETAPSHPSEPTTDAAYPDGEQNPDWPYSPGV